MWSIESWETVTGSENLLILATTPGDESLGCGGLIAQSCRRGRPPFVLVLTDGCASRSEADKDQLAAMLEQRTRRAAQRLGLPAPRLLMAGLFQGHVPEAGHDFDAVVHGITMVMWARDCNVICAPGLDAGPADRIAAHRIAIAVAAGSGVGLLNYHLPPWGAGPLRSWQLDITPDLPAKHAALDEHRTPVVDLPAHEVFAAEHAR